MHLKDIEKQIEFYEKLKQIVAREPANETEAIFLKYVELRRTPDVAAHLNRQGKRIQGSKKLRLYISTDITAILDDPEAERLVAPEVYKLVKHMQKSGRLLQKHIIEADRAMM